LVAKQTHRQIVALARRYSIPTIYELRDFAVDGGLISYGTGISDVFRQAGILAGRILKGEKPANLPVVPVGNIVRLMRKAESRNAWVS
jgi:putative ABC transport system substrate-binding protein